MIKSKSAIGKTKLKVAMVKTNLKAEKQLLKKQIKWPNKICDSEKTV